MSETKPTEPTLAETLWPKFEVTAYLKACKAMEEATETMREMEIAAYRRGYDDARAALAKCEQERDALMPDEQTVMVRVTRELLPHLGEWTARPVHVLVEGEEGGVARLVFRESEALHTARAELAAMRERVLACRTQDDWIRAADVRAAVEGTTDA